jgi:hypothetical protein
LGPEVDVGKKGSDPYQRAFAPDTKSIAKKKKVAEKIGSQ